MGSVSLSLRLSLSLCLFCSFFLSLSLCLCLCISSQQDLQSTHLFGLCLYPSPPRRPGSSSFTFPLRVPCQGLSCDARYRSPQSVADPFPPSLWMTYFVKLRPVLSRSWVFFSNN